MPKSHSVSSCVCCLSIEKQPYAFFLFAKANCLQENQATNMGQRFWIPSWSIVRALIVSHGGSLRAQLGRSDSTRLLTRRSTNGETPLARRPSRPVLAWRLTLPLRAVLVFFVVWVSLSNSQLQLQTSKAGWTN